VFCGSVLLDMIDNDVELKEDKEFEFGAPMQKGRKNTLSNER